VAKVHELIKRLLALADPAKNSNKHEREAARAKAEMLMKQHNIKEKEVKAPKRSTPDVDNIMAHWRTAARQRHDMSPEAREKRAADRKAFREEFNARQKRRSNERKKASNEQLKQAKKSAADALRNMGIDPETFL